MTIKGTLGILLLIGIFTTACEKQARNDEDLTSADIENSSDSLTYIFKDYSKQYGDCAADTSAYCTRIQLNYPEFNPSGHSPVANVMNEQIESYVLNQFFPDSVENKSIDMFVERFFNDYKEVKEAFDEAFGWYAKINGRVLRNDSVSVTIELNADIYTGGAHGSFNRQYLNFDPETGTLIDFESLFRDGYSDPLNNIVERKFRETHDVQSGMDLSDEGYEFEEGKYYNDKNFALLPDGIKFYYNSYDIAPYAKGPSEAFVTYEELRDLLKDGQPLV